MGRLAVTFEDGSTGLCHTTDVALTEWRIHQWINEGIEIKLTKGTFSVGAESFKVTCARIGDSANMVAVGCTDGTVILFRCRSVTIKIKVLYRLSESFGVFGHPDKDKTPVPTPVRKLNLRDWGHGPEITGIPFSMHAKGLALSLRTCTRYLLEWR